MLTTVIAYASNTIVVGTVSLLVGVFFSQKIKDFLSGVPSELRAAMGAVEAKTKADIKSAYHDVLAKLPTGVAEVIEEVVPDPAPEPKPEPTPAPPAA